jgi:ketosteroid isomerase-like protein
MSLVQRALAAAAVGLALACAGRVGPVDTTADEAAIRAIDARWNDYLKTQNDSAIGAIYAADAVLLPPGMPRVTGAAAIRQFWAGIWPLKASLVLEPVTVRVSGDWAIEEGNWTWSAPAQAGPQNDNGKYLVAWHRVEGTWKAAQDMWNSDRPQAPPPAAVK